MNHRGFDDTSLARVSSSESESESLESESLESESLESEPSERGARDWRRSDSEPLTLFGLELALELELEELEVELELELSTDFSSSGWIDPLPNVFTQLSLLSRTCGS